MDFPTIDANDTPMDVLVKLSNHYGAIPTMVLAGGGNTSMKTEDTLFVKASGTALATCGASGFVEMRRQPLLDLLDKDVPADTDAREEMYKEAALAARVHPELGQRPSVEAVLHNLMPGTFVVHSHSTLVNMLTCCENGKAVSEELFGDAMIWIDFTDPGLMLTHAMRKALAEYKDRTGREKPDAVIMQNHGLIISGESAGEIRELTDRLLSKISEKLQSVEAAEPFGKVTLAENPVAAVRATGPALRGAMAETPDALPVVTFMENHAICNFVGGADVATYVEDGALNPDQIVYCKRRAMLLEAGAADESGESLLARIKAAVAAYQDRAGFLPKIVVAEGLGLFGVGPDYKTARTSAEVFADAIVVMSGALAFGGVRALPDRDAEFIENWEVESYRRKVAAAGKSKGRVEGKVAVVTGAAQGFGLEIAEGLAEQGAHVVLADLNADGAATAAKALSETYGRGRAMGIKMNVTDAASITEGLDSVIRAYGGFDVFVSNAGVLKAESVKTQPQKDFEFVTQVNYTGYFLTTQAAGAVLAAQHAACEGYMSDIIQINSKSGLVGSNRNAAYAGSKFGGIGLTQSFALELIEDGVKVNSVCPGNFYDGPLWSDPENGLFVQYLRAGKIPGAKTVADVRKAYEAKSPIHRGCETADVLKAIFYLIDQTFETGQALPVTGGQVMLA